MSSHGDKSSSSVSGSKRGRAAANAGSASSTRGEPAGKRSGAPSMDLETALFGAALSLAASSRATGSSSRRGVNPLEIHNALSMLFGGVGSRGSRYGDDDDDDEYGGFGGYGAYDDEEEEIRFHCGSDGSMTRIVPYDFLLPSELKTVNKAMATSKQFDRVMHAFTTVPADDGSQGLVITAFQGQTSIVASILDNDDEEADPEANDNQAMIVAAYRGHVGVLDLLMKDERTNPAACNSVALVLAAKFGRFEAVSRLLRDARVDPSVEKCEVLRIAAKAGKAELVARLIADRRVDPSISSFAPLRYAIELGHTAVVVVLLKHPKVAGHAALPACLAAQPADKVAAIVRSLDDATWAALRSLLSAYEAERARSAAAKPEAAATAAAKPEIASTAEMAKPAPEATTSAASAKPASEIATASAAQAETTITTAVAVE